MPRRRGLTLSLPARGCWLALCLAPAQLVGETVVPTPSSSGVPHPGGSLLAPEPSPPPPSPSSEEKEVKAGPPRPDEKRIIPAQISPRARDRAKALALYAKALRIENQDRDPAAALPTFLEIVDLDPKFVKAHLQITYYYFRLRQHQDALEHLEKALRTNPDSGDLKSAASRAYYLMGKHDEAEDLAREVIADDPTNLSAFRSLVEIFGREERPDAIDELMQEALKRETGDGKFFLDLASLYRLGLDNAGVKDEEQIIASAQPFYEYALEKGEKSELLYSLLAESAARLGQNESAVDYAKKAIEIGDDNVKLYRRLAAYQVQNKDYQEALKSAQKAWDLAPYDENVWQLLVQLHLQMDQAQKAVDVLLQVIEIAPKNSDAYNQLAALYAELKNPKKATDILVRAAKRFPGNLNLTLLCGDLLRKQKRYQEGIKLLELAVKKTPTQPVFYQLLADFYSLAGKPDQAQFNYEQAIALDSGNPGAHIGLAMLQVRENKLENAARTLAKARRLFPTSARVAISEATLARRQKNYDAALNHLSQFEALVASQEGYRLPEGFFLEKGYTLELMERWDDSEQALQMGLKAHPSSHLLQNALAYQWAERGRNLPEALLLSEATVKKVPKNGAYLDTLGWIYYKMGEPEKALPLLKTAALATENDPVVIDHLAHVQAALGRTKEARELWEQLLKEDPEDTKLPKNQAIKDALEKLNEKSPS